jgi:tetratricopeptide (TPR) repeat protein
MQLLDRYGRGTPRSQLLAGQMARMEGDAQEAERRYLSILDKLPEVRIELADLYATIGRKGEARRQWEAFCDACRQKLNAMGAVSDDERLLAASAARQLGRFAEAEQWLIDATQTPEVKAVLTQLYAAWWDSVAEENRTATDLEMLQRGLRVDPWNQLLLARILTAARLDDARGESAREALKEMVAVGDLPATAYVLLGTDAFERGDRETAERYLRQARRLDPRSAVALNNLAWTMLTSERPDLNAALAAAESAVALSPGDPHFRDTRFRILSRLGRWREAVDDLEFCAAQMNGVSDFHRAAAEVYDHLGLSDLAAVHRNKARD